MEKTIGRVEPEERDQIQKLHRRKVALGELFLLLAKMPPDGLYERLVGDMGVTTEAFQYWWRDVAAKYGWQGEGPRRIDFESCEIFQVE